MRKAFFFERAFLPGGWRRDVRVEVDDGDIVSVTPGAKAEAGDHRETLVVPAMPNLHSHSFQRAIAGMTERRGPTEDSFWTWREAMYRFALRMGPDEVEAIATYCFADMLEAGFTTVGEFHYVHNAPDGMPYADRGELALRHLSAAERVGIAITLLPVFYAASDFGGQPPKEGQRRFINSVDSFAEIVAKGAAASKGRKDRRIGIAPHSLRAAPPEMLKAIVPLPTDGPIHIHIAEQVKEVNDSIAWSGKRPVEWLLEHHDVDGRWCLIHATHMTEQETSGVARSGAVVGLCPITEANLGDGIFPAKQFLAEGGMFGVGSDSNVEIDAPGELRILEYGQRLRHRGRAVLASPEEPSTGQRLFEKSLAGGAQALAVPGAGFAPGNRADFIVLDHQQADLAAARQDDILDTWIFSTGRKAIRKVAAGGRVVVEGGRHVERTAIDARYRAAVTKLLEDAGS